ncbi:ku70-like protein [Rhodocollybia butyracea]|uniref:ATP-dependent DNA helicase II subunit 1 n=1 Tax=Rhodocollybia butyracea TaxID=206335 RepID=A0A9P5Q0Q8_9AGAR|nr:ku70-like protein [Rhodocollybia butyracea]
MAPYDEWNKIEDDDDDELQDNSFFDSKKDVILFCIDCSPSMLELRPDPESEDPNLKTSHLYTALTVAMQLQKRKVVTNPNDSFGILLFNTSRKPETSRKQGSEIKKNMVLFQPIAPISAPAIQELIQLLSDPGDLQKEFPPSGTQVAIGDLFTSCNWVFRDGAPKTATKRVFLITDEDNPHPGHGAKQLRTSAETTLHDLLQAGVGVEPFFIETEEKRFNMNTFYSHVLQNQISEEDDEEEDANVLKQSISISRIEDLLSQMKFREVAKRALFSIPLELAQGFTIGVKGYGLVTEQKRGDYKYFVDLGDRLEVALPKTGLLDEDRQAEVNKSSVVYGMAVVGAAPSNENDGEEDNLTATKVVKSGQRPFYTPDEMRSFRTLGLEPGFKLLGFKPRDTLKFEDNVKHSLFIYPDENTYAGSKRTFTALLKSMVKKKVIGLALGVIRRNANPTFYAVLPQEENVEEMDPAGFHLIPLPFADDIRSAPIEEGYIAPDNLKDAARAWINKMTIKSGYIPDAYPNPALAYHYEQLEASAFQEEFNAAAFEDHTEPKLDLIHKAAGKLLKEWKTELANDESANFVVATTGSKRKGDGAGQMDKDEVLAKFNSGTLAKYKVDELKAFCRGVGLGTTGKKADLIERVEGWCEKNKRK